MNPRTKTKAQLVAELERLQKLLDQSSEPITPAPRSAISGTTSPDLLRTIIESLDEAIVVIDADDVIRFTSGRLAELSLLSEAPAVGSRFHDMVEQLDPLGARAGEIRAALLDASPGERQWFRTHDKRVIESRWLNTSPDSWRILVLQDVTQRASWEERTRHSIKLEAIGRLAAGIAHDFNNILFTITSACELARLTSRGQGPFQRELGEIETAAERAATLTRHLVAFSRQQVLQRQEVDLNELVLGLQRMIERFSGEHIEVVLNLAAQLDPIHADRQSLEGVVLSLVANARDAMPDGGRLTITTANVIIDDEEASRMEDALPGAHVLLAISDTGHGLSDDERTRIFEPFFTARQQAGSGFGLASVYGVVRQHGASIVASSTPSRGTVFEIYFRRHTGEERQTGLGEEKRASASGQVVLLAEDQDIPRDAACRTLQQQGFQVLAARDGREALEIASRHDGPIHLLVTDVLMPYVNGPELFRRLSASRPGLRAVFMSGQAAIMVNADGSKALGDAWLAKPFPMSALVACVREVLSRSGTG